MKKCPRCSNSAAPNRASCVNCLEKARVYSAARRAVRGEELNAIRRRKSTAEYQREWRLKNLGKAREMNRGYYARTREQRVAAVRKWQGKNTEYLLTTAHNRRARLRGAAGGMTLAAWESVLSVFDNKCAYCGASERLSRDHVYPLPCGKPGCRLRHGKDEPGNVVPACNRCNPSKGHRDPKPWIARAIARVALRLSGAI